jgi:hypothetical protein
VLHPDFWPRRMQTFKQERVKASKILENCDPNTG